MITNKLFCICVPSYNRSDLLNPNLIRYTNETFPNTEIIICDNGRQSYYEHKNITVLKQEINLFVSKSWNLLCDYAFEKYPFVWMINDDVDFFMNESDIVDLLNENKGYDFYNSFHEWSSFIVPLNTWQTIGKFDESMSCYFSDNDYDYRMKKAGARICLTIKLSPKVFRRTQTIEKDPLIQNRFELDRQAYIKKWKGGVGSEMV